MVLFGNQIKEMGERNTPSDIPRVSEQFSDKKKGFVDWVNLMKPTNEEKDHWVRGVVVLLLIKFGIITNNQL